MSEIKFDSSNRVDIGNKFGQNGVADVNEKTVLHNDVEDSPEQAISRFKELGRFSNIYEKIGNADNAKPLQSGSLSNNTNVASFPRVNSTLYLKPLKQGDALKGEALKREIAKADVLKEDALKGNTLKNLPVEKDFNISMAPQKQEAESDSNIFSRFFSFLKNLFCGEPNENDNALTADQAWTIVKSDAINDENTINALDFLAAQSSTGGGFFLFRPSKQRIIKDFCANLIKDVTDIDSLLKLRKRIFSFSGGVVLKNSEDRDLFINALINEIDDRVNEKMKNRVHDKIRNPLKEKDPKQTIKVYKEMLSYIKNIKDEMPAVAQPSISEQIEWESMNFLVNRLVEIAADDFRAKCMLAEILPKPHALRFFELVDERRREELNSLKREIEALRMEVHNITY